MKTIGLILLLSLIAFAGGYIMRDRLQSTMPTAPDRITNAMQIITNIEYRMNTIFIPQAYDNARYTNLYVDSTNLMAQVNVLTDEISSLSADVNGIHPFAGVGFVRGDIPVAVGAGIQYREWIGEVTVSFTGVSSLMAYYRF